MKSFSYNYFKDKKIYQWDLTKDLYVITKTDIEEEFCLDQQGMDLFLKFQNPKIKLGKVLEVESGSLKARIKLRNEVLSLPNLQFTNTLKFNVDKMKTAVKIAKFAPIKAASRPILSGVNISNGFINATDSYLAYRSEIKSDCNVTIALRFAELLTQFNGILELKCNQNIIAYETEDTTYIGRLLMGEYPNLERIFNTCLLNYEETFINLDEVNQTLALAKSEGLVRLSKHNLLIKADNEIETEINLDLECERYFTKSYIQTIIPLILEKEKTSIIYKKDKFTPFLFDKEFLIVPTRSISEE